MTLAAPDTLAATRCPLCGQANRCAMEIERETGVPQGPCWCTKMDFSTDLLARIPEALRERACLCANCGRGEPAA